MHFLPVMWLVWSALLILFILVSLISGRIARDEDDELILHDSLDHLRQEQATIAARLHRVEPLKRTLLWLLGAASVVMIGYYLMDIYHQLQF